MNIRVLDDRVEIEGYVNAVERNSRTLWDRFGSFLERIAKGAFKRALERNPDVRLYLNHERDIGGQAEGTLSLEEDAIGLRAEATITDPEVVQDAVSGNLVGWSFGYYDTEDGVERFIENGMPLRYVKDMNLVEVSILNRTKTPAYEGTLVTVRSDGTAPLLRSAEFIYEEEKPKEPEAAPEEPAEVPAAEEPIEEPAEVPVERSEQVEPETIDYKKFEDMILEMKGGKAHD